MVMKDILNSFLQTFKNRFADHITKNKNELFNEL